MHRVGAPGVACAGRRKILRRNAPAPELFAKTRRKKVWNRDKVWPKFKIIQKLVWCWFHWNFLLVLRHEFHKILLIFTVFDPWNLAHNIQEDFWLKYEFYLLQTRILRTKTPIFGVKSCAKVRHLWLKSFIFLRRPRRIATARSWLKNCCDDNILLWIKNAPTLVVQDAHF